MGSSSARPPQEVNSIALEPSTGSMDSAPFTVPILSRDLITRLRRKIDLNHEAVKDGRGEVSMRSQIAAFRALVVAQTSLSPPDPAECDDHSTSQSSGGRSSLANHQMGYIYIITTLSGVSSWGEWPVKDYTASFPHFHITRASSLAFLGSWL